MSDKPFKFRRAHEIAGAFVLSVVLLAAILVLVTGRIQGWFERKSLYEVELPREGIQGIRAGSEVRILGIRAGRVRGVELRRAGSGEKLRRVWDVAPDEIELVALLEVRGDRNVFVGEESRAVVRKDLAGFGASFVEITRGSTKRADASARLPLSLDADVTNEVTDMVREVEKAMLPAIAQVEKAYSGVEKLTAVLASPEGDFQKAMTSLRQVMATLDEGKGTLGLLLRKEQTAEDLEHSLASMRKSMDTLTGVLKDFEEGKGAAGTLFRDEETQKQVESLVASAQETAAGLPGTVRAANATIAEIRQATRVLQGTLKEYENVAEAAQRHWLLRRFVEKDGEPEAEHTPKKKVSWQGQRGR